MKILVAYDGSRCSESALDDLNRAGLPPQGEAVLMTVAEIWLPPPGNSNGFEPEIDPFLEAAIKKYQEKGERLLSEAGMLADHAAARLRKIFRDWKITTCNTYGSPAWEIISKAEDLEPDLIVVGSHGRSALSRIVLGTISQKVLTESAVSVRVARGRNEVDASSERIIVGYDGSAGADMAVASIARRKWSPGAEVRIISVTDPAVPASVGRFIWSAANLAEVESQSDHEWLADVGLKATEKLRNARLTVTQLIVDGNPKEELVREAEKWHAECIFVGATANQSRLDRMILGSTAAAVAGRAHCSVEVVKDPVRSRSS